MMKAGSTTDAVAIYVTRDDIHRYAKAIGEENPIFHNLEAAQKAGYNDIVLAATYPTLFWQILDIPWFKNQSTMIQTEQEFEYEEVLVANQLYICQVTIIKVQKKGRKQFSKHELSINLDGKTIATSHTTILLELG